jgi:hypothetical protein
MEQEEEYKDLFLLEMVEWISGFIVPLVEIVFIGGIILFVGFYVFKGVWNAWNKSIKFFWKYKIRKKPYPEKTLGWILECIDRGIGWYDAKKLLLIKMIPENQINEIMWIYDRVLTELIGKKKFKGKNYDENIQQDLPKL